MTEWDDSRVKLELELSIHHVDELMEMAYVVANASKRVNIVTLCSHVTLEALRRCPSQLERVLRGSHARKRAIFE
jgi:hypothetical protein